MNEPTRGQRLFFGALSVACGVAPILAAFDVGPLDRGDINGGGWAYVDGRRYHMYADSPDEDGYLAKNRHLDYWQRNIPRLTRTLRVRPEDMRSWKRRTFAQM